MNPAQALSYRRWQRGTGAGRHLAAALPEDRSQPIQLEASRGQMDQKTGVSVYEGNVVITQGSMRLTADTATIYVKDNNFQRMEAIGRPSQPALQADADKPEIQGTSKRVEYDVLGAQGGHERYVRVVQGQDVFTGERVEYDLKDDVIRAKGARVRTVASSSPSSPKPRDAAPAHAKKP
jgi:lipopolysaccharide export system protein LptA